MSEGHNVRYDGPSLPAISAFSLPEILAHLHVECGDASDALLTVADTFRRDFGQELRRKLQAETRIQLVNARTARRAHSQHDKTAALRAKFSRGTLLQDEVDHLTAMATRASKLAKSVASKLHRLQKIVDPDSNGSVPPKYRTLNLLDICIVDGTGETLPAGSVRLSNSHGIMPTAEGMIPVTSVPDSAVREPYHHEASPSHVSSELVADMEHTFLSEDSIITKVSCQEPEPACDSLLRSTDSPTADAHDATVEPVDEMTPQDFEQFMAASITKFRAVQDTRNRERPPVFNDPPPILSLQNPINLLYSAVLSKPGFLSPHIQRSRPPFSLFSTKSDPTIMQTLRTSHFKKLRISGPIVRLSPPRRNLVDATAFWRDSICEDSTEDMGSPTSLVDQQTDDLICDNNAMVDDVVGDTSDSSSNSTIKDTTDVEDSDKDESETSLPPPPRSPCRTHSPSHRKLRPQGSILKMKGGTRLHPAPSSAFAPHKPVRTTGTNTAYSPAQPLVVCAHSASATMARSSSIDTTLTSPNLSASVQASDCASIDSFQSLRLLQKIKELSRLIS